MAFRSGRLKVFEDKTTAVSSYTTAEWDSMAEPLAEQICGIFGMVIFDSLTVLTDRGHRYFIGYDGHPEDPKMAIGWAVGNTNATYRYLCVVGIFDGQLLSNALDAVTSSAISGDQYCKVMLQKQINGQNTNNYYFYYITDTHFKAITHTFADPSSSTIDSMIFQIAQFRIANKLVMGYRLNTTNYYYYSYDYYGNGVYITICALTNYFPQCKNYIANSDYEYIVAYRIEHNIAVDGLYIYSKVLTVNKIYCLNGEYYYCLSVGTNAGSYLMKINYVPGS